MCSLKAMEADAALLVAEFPHSFSSETILAAWKCLKDLSEAFYGANMDKLKGVLRAREQEALMPTQGRP